LRATQIPFYPLADWMGPSRVFGNPVDRQSNIRVILIGALMLMLKCGRMAEAYAKRPETAFMQRKYPHNP